MKESNRIKNNIEEVLVLLEKELSKEEFMEIKKLDSQIKFLLEKISNKLESQS